MTIQTAVENAHFCWFFWKGEGRILAYQCFLNLLAFPFHLSLVLLNQNSPERKVHSVQHNRMFITVNCFKFFVNHLTQKTSFSFPLQTIFFFPPFRTKTKSTTVNHEQKPQRNEILALGCRVSSTASCSSFIEHNNKHNTTFNIV